MAKENLITDIKTKNLNELYGLYNLLRKEIDSYNFLKTEYSDDRLSLILDNGTGVNGYEEGIAEPSRDLFIVKYFGIKENARGTFSNSRVDNYDITRRLQNKVNGSLNSGNTYRKRGYEQLVLVEDKADTKEVKDFFEFLITVFKEKIES